MRQDGPKSDSLYGVNYYFTPGDLFFARSRLLSCIKHTVSGFRLMLATALLLALTLSLKAQTSPLIFVTAGPHTFTVPAGVTSIKVECWGGGGSSGNNTTGRAKGGGGGGAFTGGILTVVPGTTLSIVVGARGRYSNIATATDDGGQSSVGIIVAKGGTRGSIGANLLINGGVGGTVSTNPDLILISSFISFTGGNGGNGYVASDNGGGGGGGESASSSGIGNPGGNGTNTGNAGAGGAGNPDGGDGGRGASNQNNSTNSANGNSPGGGGGGRADAHGSDRDGADGKVILTWTKPIGYCIDYAVSVFRENNVHDPNRATGMPDRRGAQLYEPGDLIELMLTNGDLLTAGGSVNVTWRKNSIFFPSIKVEVSETGAIPWITVNNYLVITLGNVWTTQSIPLPINARYIRFTSNNGFNLDIDAVSFNTPCAPPCVTPIIFDVTGGGCNGGAGLPINLSNSEVGLSYQLYQGATPKDLPISGTGLPLDFGIQPAGTYTVVSTRAIGCTAKMNGNAIVSTTAIPSPPSAIIGETSPCIGSSQTYSVTDVPGVSYTWTFPGDWILQTIIGTTNSIMVTTGTLSGNITVTPSTTCNFGAPQVQAVTPGTTVLPLNISAKYCLVVGKILLTANGGIAGDTYLWNTGETTKDILVNTAEQYSLTMTSAAGCSAKATYNTATELIVNGDFSAGNTGFNSGYTYDPPAAGAPTPGNKYTIDVNPHVYRNDFWGQDHTTNDGKFMIVNGNVPATVWTQTINVLPNTDYIFSGWAISLNDQPSSINLGFNINGDELPAWNTGILPVRAMNNVDPFDWIQFEGTWNSGATTGPIDVNIFIVAPGSATSGFGLDDISFTTMAPIPSIIAPTSDLSTLCEGEQLKLFANLTGGKDPYTYSWTGPDGYVFSTVENPVIPNVTVANTGEYALTVTDGFGCDAVTAFTSTVTVNSKPILTATPSAQTICSETASSIALTSDVPGSTYSWTVVESGISGASAGTGATIAQTLIATGTIAGTATYTITPTANGCVGTALTLTITVTPTVGTPVFTLGATSTYCQGAGSVTYTAIEPNATISYDLDAASTAGGNSIITGTGKVTYVAGWSGTSIITATATGCNGTSSAIHTTTTTTTAVGPTIFAMGTSSTRYQVAGLVTYSATATDNTGITYSLDAGSTTGGNSINSSTGTVNYSATWSGTSTIIATATGCNGPTTASHTVTIMPSTTGTTWCFALFTGNGLLSCAGASTITGDIGTQLGGVTGFTRPGFTGPGMLVDPSQCFIPGTPEAVLAAAKVVTAYDDLFDTSVGVTVSGTTLGVNPTLTPNIYTLGGALNIDGVLTLDGQGDPNALFIFKINGALTVLEYTKIVLINKAAIYNVYWQVYGAVVLARHSEFSGTIVAKDAISLETGASLMGRAISKEGAIALTTNVVTSRCATILGVADNNKPTFTPPADIIECVESLSSAVYNPSNIDINPDQNDYYKLLNSNKRLNLDPTNFIDNSGSTTVCTMAIRWRIDMSDGTHIPALLPYENGQPSDYGNFQFMGDGTGNGTSFIDFIHTITYWIVDCDGNVSDPQVRTITIKPRPYIEKITL